MNYARSRSRKAKSPGRIGLFCVHFRVSLIGVSFPTVASEFRKCGSNHEVTSMFVAHRANASPNRTFQMEQQFVCLQNGIRLAD